VTGYKLISYCVSYLFIITYTFTVNSLLTDAPNSGLTLHL